MLPPWRDELRVGLCPERLVLASAIQPTQGDPVASLKKLVGRRPVHVVLSSHYVRYAVLAWSSALRSRDDWLDYARHIFTSTYGAAAMDWRLRVSGSGRAPRVASAVDAALFESLRALPGLVSVQPYLMAAFNARRRAFGKGTRWLVLQESGRLTLALIADGLWAFVRTRQANGNWQDSLGDLLDRELASDGSPPCEQAVLCSEAEPPPQAGRYRIFDLTLPPGVKASARAHAMVLEHATA